MPDRREMSKKFIQLTSGWIPACVMLLFATALVMGQDRSALPQETVPLAAPTTPVVVPGLLDTNDHIRLESIRIFADSVLPVPQITEISIGATIRNGPDTTQPDSVTVK